MINSVSISQYYKIVSITNSLNSYIRMANLAKSQMTANIGDVLSAAQPQHIDIGSRVDVFA